MCLCRDECGNEKENCFIINIIERQINKIGCVFFWQFLIEMNVKNINDIIYLNCYRKSTREKKSPCRDTDFAANLCLYEFFVKF